MSCIQLWLGLLTMLSLSSRTPFSFIEVVVLASSRSLWLSAHFPAYGSLFPSLCFVGSLFLHARSDLPTVWPVGAPASCFSSTFARAVYVHLDHLLDRTQASRKDDYFLLTVSNCNSHMVSTDSCPVLVYSVSHPVGGRSRSPSGLYSRHEWY